MASSVFPTPEQEARLEKLYPAYKPGDLARRGRSGTVLPTKLDLEQMKNMKIYEDDVFLVTPPKSGTTWMQETLWMMCHEFKSPETLLFYRFPYLEIGSIWPSLSNEYPEGAEQNDLNLNIFNTHSIEFVNRMKRPRMIKTHLPLEFLPDQLLSTCKVVFVARNIKDTCVSYYHHYLARGRKSTFPDFAKMFLHAELLYTPNIPAILQAWEHRSNENMFFTSYEEMHRDFFGVARSLAAFLRVSMTDDQLALLKHEVSFDQYKANPLIIRQSALRSQDRITPEEVKEALDKKKKPFMMRKGVVGDWRAHFLDNMDDGGRMNEEWDRAIAEQLEGTDYKMTLELG